jgi:hypothetical protein
LSMWTPPIMMAVLNPFLYASILVSLLLQVRVIFAAERRHQLLITIFLSFIGLVEMGLQIAFQVGFIIGRVNKTFMFTEWLYLANSIVFIIFVGISCILFLYKLRTAILRRRQMGFKKFGPLDILFIMFAQCLVIPGTPLSCHVLTCCVVIIYILDMSLPNFDNLSGLAQTFLVCSLPLSALWASYENETRGQAQSFGHSTASSQVTSDAPKSKFSFLSWNRTKDSRSSDYEKSSMFSVEGVKVQKSVRVDSYEAGSPRY